MKFKFNHNSNDHSSLGITKDEYMSLLYRFDLLRDSIGKIMVHAHEKNNGNIRMSRIIESIFNLFKNESREILWALIAMSQMDIIKLVDKMPDYENEAKETKKAKHETLN